MKYGNIWFNALDLTINTLFILRVEVIVHFFALLVLQRSCLFQQEICSINHCGVFLGRTEPIPLVMKEDSLCLGRLTMEVCL